MRNNGSGLLVEGHVFFTTFENASAILPADVDGDADIDLSVADTRGFVHVFVNDGQAEFFPISVPTVPTAPVDMDGGDLDSDGDMDLAVVSSGSAHEDAEDFLSILFNDGSGRMSAGPRVATGNDPRGVAVARLDGDARPDVALTSIDDDTAEVYLNRTPPLTASAGPDVTGTEGSPISLRGRPPRELPSAGGSFPSRASTPAAHAPSPTPGRPQLR